MSFSSKSPRWQSVVVVGLRGRGGGCRKGIDRDALLVEVIQRSKFLLCFYFITPLNVSLVCIDKTGLLLYWHKEKEEEVEDKRLPFKAVYFSAHISHHFGSHFGGCYLLTWFLLAGIHSVKYLGVLLLKAEWESGCWLTNTILS